MTLLKVSISAAPEEDAPLFVVATLPAVADCRFGSAMFAAPFNLYAVSLLNFSVLLYCPLAPAQSLIHFPLALAPRWGCEIRTKHPDEPVSHAQQTEKEK
jgi:hypothetical protein